METHYSGIRILLVLLVLSLGSCRQDNGKSPQELQEGDTLGGLLVETLSIKENAYSVGFAGEKELAGRLFASRGPFGLAVEASLSQDSVLVGGQVIDLGGYNRVYIHPAAALGVLLPNVMLEMTPEGVAPSENFRPLQVELTLRAFQLTDGPQPITAELVRVQSLDGGTGPKPTAVGLDRFKPYFEDGLQHRISQLQKDKQINGLEYTQDIKNFVFYEEADAFRDYVDQLLGYGYVIKQQEGNYYLLSKHKAGAATYKISELSNGQKIEGLTVANYVYEPKDEFGFDLKGDFITQGELSHSEFSGSVTYTSDEGSKLQSMLDLGTKEVRLTGYCNIANLEALKQALNPAQRQALSAPGQAVPVKMRVRNYSFGARWQSEYAMTVEFVELLE